MSMLKKLAGLLGLREDQVEDALKSERLAKEAIGLSRRGFFAAASASMGAVLAPEKVFSFITAPTNPWTVWVAPGGIGYIMIVHELEKLAEAAIAQQGLDALMDDTAFSVRATMHVAGK